MKKQLTILLTTVFMLIVFTSVAQTYYVKSGNGINLRTGPGTSHGVITSIPQNGQVKVLSKNGEWYEVSYAGNTGYVHSQNLSEERTASSHSNHQQNRQRQTQARQHSTAQRSSSSSAYRGYQGYTTALGLRGGYTSGLSLKHFVSNDAAWEVILGSRWHGFSLTALYELHKGNALGVPGLSWEYGIGARAGFYNGRYYYRYKKGNCRDPHNPKCYPYYYYNEPILTAVGIVGIGGLEYQFREIPFTISLDLIPVFYLNHRNRGFMDGSISVRYIIN